MSFTAKIKNSEFYFTTSATSTEHDFLEFWYLRPFCARLGVELLYYRQFKTGHIPTKRECKIRGFNNQKFAAFLKWCSTRTCPIILENYWRQNNE